jgi:predicted membrane chloride channel (bestrophin family)
LHIKPKIDLEYRDDQKEPIKITLTGILRRIFGLFCIVIALGMIIEHEYFPAVFMFMAVFISFPPIST